MRLAKRRKWSGDERRTIFWRARQVQIAADAEAVVDHIDLVYGLARGRRGDLIKVIWFDGQGAPVPQTPEEWPVRVAVSRRWRSLCHPGAPVDASGRHRSAHVETCLEDARHRRIYIEYRRIDFEQAVGASMKRALFEALKLRPVDQLDTQLWLNEKEMTITSGAPPDLKTDAYAKAKPMRQPSQSEPPRDDIVLSPG